MRPVALCSGAVLGPLAWFASLEANFALAPLACSGRSTGMLLVISLVAFVLAACGSILAWTQRDVHRRVALFSAAISAFSALAIVAQAIPNLMLGGCE